VGLVGIVRGDVSKSPVAERELGRIDIRKGRWWLDLFFPDGPPPEYERLAIEISKEYVARHSCLVPCDVEVHLQCQHPEDSEDRRSVSSRGEQDGQPQAQRPADCTGTRADPDEQGDGDARENFP